MLFQFTDALIAFQPAHSFLRLLAIARPYLGIGAPQCQALRYHHQGGMKVHATAGIIVQFPQPLGVAVIEIQFGAILQTQHGVVLRGSRQGAAPMGLEQGVR